jgi:hypothetical protein
MSACWTIEDSNGQTSPALCVWLARRGGPEGRAHPLRCLSLAVSSSYREVFDRALRKVLEREGWSIVQVKSPTQLPR